jgi:hypothetical protein
MEPSIVKEYKLKIIMVKMVTEDLKELRYKYLTEINDKIVKYVDKFIYLRSEINSESNINEKINRKTQNASKFCKIMKEVL